MNYRTRVTNVKAVQWRGTNEGQIGRIIGGGRCKVRCVTVGATDEIKASKGKKGETIASPAMPERRVVKVWYDDEEAGTAEVGQWLVRGPQGEPLILDAAEFKRNFERSP